MLAAWLSPGVRLGNGGGEVVLVPADAFVEDCVFEVALVLVLRLDFGNYSVDKVLSFLVDG